MFAKKTSAQAQTYQPVLEGKEVIDLFSRLTLHHQAALLRLISRNLVVVNDGKEHMGFEYNFNVEGAMVTARLDGDQS